jgi:outer membrane protein TolC
MYLHSRLKVVFITILIILIFSGCSSVKSLDLSQRDESQNNITLNQEINIQKSNSENDLGLNPTLTEYLKYAALYNPELEAAFYRWKASLEKIPQVNSLPDPLFSYSYYIENVETRVGPQRHKIDISQTFPWFGKLDLLGDVALEEANIQKQNYEKLKLNLFYRVKDIYYEYYYLARAISITEENLRLLSYFENVARTKYESGNTSYADVIKAQVELGKLEERILSLKDMVEPVTAKMNAVLNRPENEPIPFPSKIEDENIELEDNEIIDRIVVNNPDLKALKYKIEKEIKAKELAEKQFYPNFMVGLSYIETGPSSMPGVSDSGKDPVMAMFSINLPLWREKIHASVRESEINRKSAEKELENREKTIISDLKTALYNYRDAERKKELYRDTLIPKAKQSLNITQTAFESGEKDFLSLIDSQRILLEFEIAYERALTNHVKFNAQIEMLTGNEL